METENNYEKVEEFTEYSRSIVYGSIAYDLNRLPKREVEEQTAEREQAKVKSYGRVRQTQGISLLAVCGIALFVVTMVFVLLARIQLTQISDQSAQLEAKIQQLTEDEARLKIRYESAFNLTEIEEYATKQLGMVRQSADKVVTLKTTNVDRAEIIEQEDAQNVGFFTGLKDFLTSLLEYI